MADRDRARRFAASLRRRAALGPYRIWHHEHFFRALPEGRTEVHDLVTYVPPLGPFGAVLNRFFIRPQLEKIFDYRREQLPQAPGEAAA